MMNTKTASILVFALGIAHFGINFILNAPLRIEAPILLGFYSISLAMGYGLNTASTWLSKKSKVQIGQAFMIFSFVKLVLLATVLVILIRTYQWHKLSTIVHFMFPYYFATGLSVLRLLKQLNIKTNGEDN
ncbi:MAG: hypothetical protein JXQ87_07455 [Bacteroidia bacterium]